MLRFSPRRRGSAWARSNKERVARLTAAGLMTDAGLRMVDAAKADGSWDLLTDVENLVVPADLDTALSANEAATAGFAGLSPSARKMILAWLVTAKRPETRSRRIEEVVRSAAAGRSPLDRPRGPGESR